MIAVDQFGHYDPTVVPDDILVLEDGVAQQIKSVRRIPANVILVLDTGGELSGLGGVSKRTNLTRDVALELLDRLREDIWVEVMQFNNSVDLLQTWTRDRPATVKVLKTKVSSGKRARFSDAVAAAAQQLKDRPEGSRHVIFITDGVDTLMFLYPYVKDKKKVFLYSQIGNIYTTILFTSITMVCITFFAENGLARTIWPVLSMFKIVRLPNLERFEFIAVSFWMLVILPNMCSYLWAASKGFSRIINWKQKKGIWIIGILVWVGSFFIKARYQMNSLTDFIAKLGFFAAFCYPILLSVLVLVKKWFLRRKKTSAEAS